MTEPMTYLTLASFGLVALGITIMAALKGWQGWLEIKQLEIAGGQQQAQPRSSAMERIELADLKERIRKLESIAACVDL
jgi:hypothetical protein